MWNVWGYESNKTGKSASQHVDRRCRMQLTLNWETVTQAQCRSVGLVFKTMADRFESGSVATLLEALDSKIHSSQYNAAQRLSGVVTIRFSLCIFSRGQHWRIRVWHKRQVQHQPWTVNGGYVIIIDTSLFFSFLFNVNMSEQLATMATTINRCVCVFCLFHDCVHWLKVFNSADTASLE